MSREEYKAAKAAQAEMELKLYMALVFLMVFALLFSVSRGAFAGEMPDASLMQDRDLPPASLPYGPDMAALGETTAAQPEAGNGEMEAASEEALASAESRSSRRIAGEDAQTCIAEALEESGAGEGLHVRLTGASKSILWQGKEEVQWSCKVESLDEQAQTAAASLQIGNESMPLEVRYEVWQKLPVLNRRLARGEVIGEADIAWKTFNPKTVRDDSVQDEASLIGFAPTRTIREGSMIRRGQVSRPSVIHKGDMVSMVYRTLNLEVKATAVALDNGGQGDIVSVRNMDSNKQIRGIVRGPGLIEVMPLPAMHQAASIRNGR